MTFRERAIDLVEKMTTEEKLGQVVYEAEAIDRLGIKAYNWWSECLHGAARAGTATVFPQAIGLAASFDTDLMEKVAEAISVESRAHYNMYRSFGDNGNYEGVSMCAPNINIVRDPRWGRGQETYGEDPYLTAEMAVAYVNGLQGKGDYHRTDATLKHFAVHSGPETLRHGFDACPSEEDLNDTYLYAFRECIRRTSPAAVMTAYNAVHGEPCSISPTLHRILREKWGFKGFVESDAGSVGDLITGHHRAKDTVEAVAIALNAGCQMNICGRKEDLVEAWKRGLIDEEKLHEACVALFEARFRLGEFDGADCPYNSLGYEDIECEAHQALNRKMAEESIVLLKNDGILPLKPGKTIAVIGPNANDPVMLKGNYFGTASHAVTPLEGIRHMNKARVFYAEGCDATRKSRDESDRTLLKEAVIAVRSADIVILCLGLNQTMEGEEGVGGDRTTLDLPENQKKLLAEIAALGKPVICVNFSGGCVNLCEADSSCNALLQAFYPGSETGYALADILFGRVSPCGRLPVTFYRSDADLPPFESYDMAGRTHRFFKGSPLYPFGHSLSYTSFQVSEEAYQDGIFSCTLSNTGDMDANRSVLLFDGKNLVAFTVVFLKKGESKTVTLPVGEGHCHLTVQ